MRCVASRPRSSRSRPQGAAAGTVSRPRIKPWTSTWRWSAPPSWRQACSARLWTSSWPALARTRLGSAREAWPLPVAPGSWVSLPPSSWRPTPLSSPKTTRAPRPSTFGRSCTGTPTSSVACWRPCSLRAAAPPRSCAAWSRAARRCPRRLPPRARPRAPRTASPSPAACCCRPAWRRGWAPRPTRSCWPRWRPSPPMWRTSRSRTPA
mmetsp:Transcript_91641/g.238833  ORF Transcript_91641/g.238833 Transcript_91641/m.238833 type:complete len:208 (-) Transcript_91641:619-1242(-)